MACVRVGDKYTFYATKDEAETKASEGGGLARVVEFVPWCSILLPSSEDDGLKDKVLNRIMMSTKPKH